MPVRVIIQQEPHPLSRTYMCNCELAHYPIAHFHYPLDEEHEREMSDIGGWNKLGDAGQELVRKILQIRGVKEIFIHPYELSVHISELFSFDEDIDPFVLDALREALNEGELQIEKKTRIL